MNNPFIPAHEPIADLPEGVLTFTLWLEQTQERFELKDEHMEWIVKNMKLYIPEWILVFWENMADWPPIGEIIGKLRLAVQVGDPPCAMCAAGKTSLCTGREGEPFVRLVVNNKVVAEY
jgi:hypothetical protein